MKLGFIGSGKMAAALVEGVLHAGVFAKGDILITDRYEAAVKALVKKCRVKSVPDNATLVAQSDVIVCCVKPGDAAALAAALDAALAMPHAARAAMGAAARASVQARYTTAALQDATIEAYRAVLG